MSKLFTQTLAEINGGRVADDATTALANLIAECLRVRKKGSLMLTVHIKPGKGDARNVTVTGEVKVKAPVFDSTEDFFFVARDGDLTRNHPDQGELPLRAVTSGIDAPLRGTDAA